MDYQKLKGLIRARGRTYADVSKASGISISAFNNKMTGKTEFTIDEVRRVAYTLDIPSVEIVTYFFDKGDTAENEDIKD